MKCGSSAAECRGDAAPLARLRSATVYEVYTPCSRIRDCADVGPCPRGTSANATDYAGWMAVASATGGMRDPCVLGAQPWMAERGQGCGGRFENAPTDYPVFTLLSNVLLERGDLLLQEATSDWRGPLGVTLMIGRSVFVAFAAEGAGGHVATVHGVPCVGNVAGHKGHEYRYPAHDFECELRRGTVVDGQRRAHVF